MTETLGFALSAAGLGLLTAVHPCPLTGHLGALALLSGWAERPRRVWRAGLALAAGFATAYVALGMLLSYGIASAPGVAVFMQNYLTRLLGPFMVLAGMLLAGLLVPGQTSGWRDRVSAWLARSKWGNGAAFPVGVLLALSFCPASAALFFGVLLPLTVTKDMPFLLPAAYGVGVAVPLALAAFLVAFGTRWIGPGTDHSARFRSVRWVAGSALILIGIAHALRHVYGIL